VISVHSLLCILVSRTQLPFLACAFLVSVDPKYDAPNCAIQSCTCAITSFHCAQQLLYTSNNYEQVHPKISSLFCSVVMVSRPLYGVSEPYFLHRGSPFTIPSSAIGTPEKSALSQNPCFYLLSHKIVNIEIILYLLEVD